MTACYLCSLVPVKFGVVVYGLMLVGCQRAPTLDGWDVEGTGTSSDGSGAPGTGTGFETQSGTGDGGTTTSFTGGADDGTGGDLNPDAGEDPRHCQHSCDVWDPRCPSGCKCTAYASPGERVWDANGCFPIDPEPRGRGESCLMVGSFASGLDNCEQGAICLGPDPEVLEGECVEFCTGGSGFGECSDPLEACVVFNDGVLPVCMPICDPRLQDCDEGLGCYGSQTGGTVCLLPDPPPPGGEAGYGAECGSVTSCEPGLQCMAGDNVPDCTGTNCCTPWCDTSAPNTCPDADRNQACVPYWEPGEAPPGFEELGLCLIP